MKPQTGLDAPFQRAGEPVQGFLGRNREAYGTGKMSWVVASYLLFWAGGEGPSGHKMRMGHLTMAVLIIWQKERARALTWGSSEF